MIFNKIWHGPAAAVSHYYPFFRCSHVNLSVSHCYGICFYKNILQHYHKIEKSKTAEERARERERKTIKTASWPRQNIWRVLKTRPQPCVLALSGFATLMSCIFIARTPLTYLPPPPCTPLSMCRANILRKSCRKIDGKCDFGKRVCVLCVCVGVDWSATSSSKKEKRKEEGKGKSERERWRFQRIFIASGYLS